MRQVFNPYHPNQLMWRIANERPYPEGLSFGVAFKGATGKHALPSMWAGDKIIADVRYVHVGWRKGMWKAQISTTRTGGSNRAGEYVVAYFATQARAVEFMQVATPEAYRP